MFSDSSTGANTNKKEMCEAQLDKATDELKATETSVSDLAKATAAAKELQATLTGEIAVWMKEMKNLDKQVEDAGINDVRRTRTTSN